MNTEKKKETLNTRDVLLGIGKKVMLVAAAAGALNFVSKQNKEVMDTEQAKDAEVLRVDGISIHGGPNLRYEPEVPDNPEESNILAKFDGSQPIELPYDGEVCIYNGPNDANGEWCGFPAEEFADTLCDAGCISEIEKKMINKHEQGKDGYVWINSQYVDLNKIETEDADVNS